MGESKMNWTLPEIDMVVAVACVCAVFVFMVAEAMKSSGLRRLLDWDYWALTVGVVLIAAVAYLLIRPMMAWFLVKTLY